MPYRIWRIISQRLVPYRNTLEPLLVFHRQGRAKLLKETGFLEKVLHWREECLDTTYFGLDALARIGDDGVPTQQLITKHKEDILRFVVANFDWDKGGFRQCSSAPPTLYATNAAIAIAKRISGAEYFRQPLGYERIVALLGSQIAKKMIDFTSQSIDEETGGFFEEPNKQYQPSIRQTYSACFILWNLGKDQHLKESTKSFILSRCLRSGSRRGIGFADTPGEEPLTCSTYYALRTLVLLDEDKWIKENRKEIIEFLRSCWTQNHKTGGFGPTPDSSPTLIHSALTLSALIDILGENTDELDRTFPLEKISNMMLECKSEYGGFKFAPGRLFAPNLYMTRNAIFLANRFKEKKCQLNIKFDLKHYEEFVCRFSEERNGIFSGYHPVGKKIFRKIVDFLLYPKNPRRMNTTHIPYLIGLSFAVLIMIGLYLFLDNGIAMYLSIGPLGLGIVAAIEILEWFIKDRR